MRHRLLVVLFATLPAGAWAQETRLRGDYVVSLGFLTVGRGGWDVRVSPTSFTVSGQGATAGLIRLFDSGHGHARADGAMHAGTPDPARYDSMIVKRDRPNEVHLRLTHADVAELTLLPAPRPSRKAPDPAFVALEPAHRHGVHDPISAVLMPTRTPLGPASCARISHVFDGSMRYDLDFHFLRVEQVKTATGYAGPVVVCGVKFTPIGGYLSSRPGIMYLRELTSMEVWLAPIAGADLLVPWRVVIPTPFGDATLQAERFSVTQNNTD